jgi:transcriptional regulator with XRE-family HTH domain
MARRNFNDLAAKIPPAKLDAARRALEEELDAHERTLTEVRRARALTQVQLAQALGVTQSQVSRIESQGDLFLSTLASYLEAMGGRLELRVVFDDIDPVTLAIGERADAASDQADGAVRARPAP